MSGEKIQFGATRKRGEYTETIVRDTTRVGHPPAASIFEKDGEFLIVPINPQFPIQERDNYNSAVNFVEQIIPDEGRRVR
jgi:hypothetical protein